MIDVLKSLSTYISIPLLCVFGWIIFQFWQRIEKLKNEQIKLGEKLNSLKNQEIKILERHIDVLREGKLDPTSLLSSVELLEKANRRELEDLRKQYELATAQYQNEKEQRENLEKTHSRLKELSVIDQELHEIREMLLQSFLRWNRFKWLPSFDDYKKITAYSDELGNELDNQKLAFMLKCALWYGHDVVYWAERNKENNEIIPILLEALQRPERRPFYRTGLAIEHLSLDFRDAVIKHIREQLPDNKEVETIVNKAEKNETLKFWEKDLPKMYDSEKAKQLVGRAKTSKRVNNQTPKSSITAHKSK